MPSVGTAEVSEVQEQRWVGDGVLAAFWTVVVLWLLAALGFVGVLVGVHLLAGDWCTDRDTSAAGRASWSWTELGRVCRWNGPSGPYETGPGPWNWVTAIGLAVVGLVLLAISRWIRWRRTSARRVASS